MDYTKVLLALVELIGIVLTTVAIPWLKSKLTNEQIANFQAWVKIGVAAAEQLFPKEMCEAKKTYVVNFLHEKGFKFDASEIDKAIEAEVLYLHNALKGN